MKYLVFSFGLIPFLFSCESSSQRELIELKKENAMLKKQLKDYDNAIVITSENINNYMGALAYGPFEVKPNEPASLTTYLYLHDLPVKVKWKADQENQSVQENGQIGRSIENTFPGAGKRTLSGTYSVIFPNGEEWNIPWERTVTVK